MDRVSPAIWRITASAATGTYPWSGQERQCGFHPQRVLGQRSGPSLRQAYPGRQNRNTKLSSMWRGKAKRLPPCDSDEWWMTPSAYPPSDFHARDVRRFAFTPGATPPAAAPPADRGSPATRLVRTQHSTPIFHAQSTDPPELADIRCNHHQAARQANAGDQHVIGADGLSQGFEPGADRRRRMGIHCVER